MRTAKLGKWVSLVLLASVSIGVYATVVGSTAASGPQRRGHVNRPGRDPLRGPSVTRIDLKGYVIDATYSLGRNTGNTFRQTYTDSSVQGVPIAGPNVGSVFPPESYVAMPIGHHEIYVAWLDPSTDALVDVFVMNFRTNVVFDYAPGSTSPESSGTIRLEHRGAVPLP
jgi:hypothetical protein